MMRFHILLVIIFVYSIEGYENKYDADFEFECEDGKHIGRIYSWFNKKKKDRRWGFDCKKGLVSGKNDENNCNWTEPLNNYDYPVNFTCPEDQIITGFYSYHSNWKEDRRWYVKCCKIAEFTPTRKNCKWTTINKYTKWMNYTVPLGTAISGIESKHHQGNEDRRWRMFTCEYMNCQVTDLELLESPELSDLRREVVKIATSFSCQDSTNSLSMSRVDSAEESYSVSDMTGSSRGVSETVTLSGQIGLEIISVGLESSETESNEWYSEKTKTNEDSKSYSNEASHDFAFDGPAIGMIMGVVTIFDLKQTGMKAQYIAKCVNESDADQEEIIREDTIVDVKIHQVGHTHFTNKAVKIEKKMCDLHESELRQCVHNIVLSPHETPESATERVNSCINRFRPEN